VLSHHVEKLRSTTLVLNYHRLRLQKLSPGENEYNTVVVQALKSLTNMGVQTIEFGDPKISEQLYLFPFWSAFMMYITAVILTSPGELLSSDQEKKHGLKVIKDYLYSLNNRWRIAGISIFSRLSSGLSDNKL
jgi:hypothetical protein